MNRIYRLVFNRALGVMQVASEVAQNPGGSAVCAGRVPRLRAHQLAVALAATLASGSVFAACSTPGPTITCTGTTNNFVDATNGVQVTVAAGANVGSTAGLGNSLTLSGNGIQLTNNGTIGTNVGLFAASGAVLGNASGQAISVTNSATGTLQGFIDIGSLLGANGRALSVQNGAGGVTTINNAGTVNMNFLLGGLGTADAPAIVSYGGAQTILSNSGGITGRVGLAGSTLGNSVNNSGTITGSVHLGDSAQGNTFTAVSGSSSHAPIVRVDCTDYGDTADALLHKGCWPERR